MFSAIYLSLWYALIFFGIGTFLASVGYGLAYFAQGNYYRDSAEKIAGIRKNAMEDKPISLQTNISLWHRATLCCCIGAYLAFFVGVWFSACGFHQVVCLN